MDHPSSPPTDHPLMNDSEEVLIRNRSVDWAIVAVACSGMAVVVVFVVHGASTLLYHDDLSFHVALFLLPILWGLSTVVKFLRFRFFKRVLGFKLDMLPSLTVYLCGLAFSMTPGRLGECMKSYFLDAGHGFSKSATLPINIGERVTDMLTVALLATFVGRFLPMGVYATTLVITGCGMGCFFLVRSPRGSVWVTDRVHWMTRGRMSPDRLQRFLTSFREVFSSRHIMGGCLYSGVARCVDGGILWVVVTGLGATIHPLDALGVLSVAALAGGLSQLPGGVGVAEGGMALLLTHHGMSGELAIAVAVITRTFTWWLGVLVGFVVWMAVRKEFTHSCKLSGE